MLTYYAKDALLMAEWDRPFFHQALQFGSWLKKLNEQLSKIRLEYIWQDLRENSVTAVKRILTIAFKRVTVKKQEL
jgi:hypothetical protein